MGTCERINCGYYWKEEWEDFPSCKFHGFGLPPVRLTMNTARMRRIEKSSSFLCKLPIDKPASMWYNSSGGTTGRGRRTRPDFPIATPICKISYTSSDFSYVPDFSRNHRGPIGTSIYSTAPRKADRSSTFHRELPRFNKHMDLETYLKCSHISSHDFTLTLI